MSKSTLTFRADTDHKKALDKIAAAMDRDRSFILNEALRAFIETYRWQVEEIQSAVKEADADDFASAADVEVVFTKLKTGR